MARVHVSFVKDVSTCTSHFTLLQYSDISATMVSRLYYSVCQLYHECILLAAKMHVGACWEECVYIKPSSYMYPDVSRCVLGRVYLQFVRGSSKTILLDVI